MLDETLFSRFAEWNAAVHCIAAVDVLMSFAVYAQKQDGVVCIPKVTPVSPDPQVGKQDHKNLCLG